MTDAIGISDPPVGLITDELLRRPSRTTDAAAENRALIALSQTLGEAPDDVLQALTDTLIDLGIADSAGVSILASDSENRFLRMEALSGDLGGYRGGTMPLDASPCGVVVDTNQPQLFAHPASLFANAAVEPPVLEILLVPFRVDAAPAGALWIVAHRPDRRFDREDVRLLEAVAGFASAGYRIGRRSQAASLPSDVRLRTLLTGIPQLVWSAGEPAQWTWASPQWCAYTGQAVEDSLGLGWLDSVHPDDRQTARSAWDAARSKGRFEVEYRIRRGRDGPFRWFQTRATPVRDDAGTICEWLGTSTDVDDLRALQDRQRLLVAELQHRVRNTLGVIRSIVRRTAETSSTAEEMAAHLGGRIEAFSRVQSIVTRDPGAGISLLMLVEEELRAFAIKEGMQLGIRGEPIMLNPRAAESISLAIHELTTNSVKHGALSARHGRVSIGWHFEDDRLRFTWSESGLDSLLDVPAADGFGTELLLESLPYELDAETTLDFAPEGLCFTLDAPLKNLLEQGFGGQKKEIFTAD